MACAITEPPAVALAKQDTMGNTSDKDNETTKSDNDNLDVMCIVCWEATATQDNNDSDDNCGASTRRATVALPCGHLTCRTCIVQWIERCEANGLDEATCPHCRSTLDGDVILALVGRPYERVIADVNLVNDLPVDDFTQVWLDDHDAHHCPNCQMPMINEDDDEQDRGDDDDSQNSRPGLATACPCCGFVYCWKCREGAADCDCDQDMFYDYSTNQELPLSQAEDYPVATEQDLAGDLADFLDRRRRVIYGEEDNDNDDDDEEVVALVEEEDAGADLVALFERACGCAGAASGHNHTTECLVGREIMVGVKEEKRKQPNNNNEGVEVTETTSTTEATEIEQKEAGETEHAELVALFDRTKECCCQGNHNHTTACLANLKCGC